MPWGGRWRIPGQSAQSNPTAKTRIIVKGGVRPVLRQPDPAAPVIARAEPGVVGRLLECRGAWCKVETGEVTGWMRRGDVWGVYPEENIP